MALDVVIEFGEVGDGGVVVRVDFVQIDAVDVVLAVELEVFFDFGFDFGQIASLLDGAHIDDVLEAHFDVFRDDFHIARIEDSVGPGIWRDKDIGDFLAARVMHRLPVVGIDIGVGLRQRVFVRQHEDGLGADFVFDRLDVRRIDGAIYGIADAEFVGFITFDHAVFGSIDPDARAGFARLDGGALHAPAHANIVHRGAAMLDFDVHADVFIDGFIDRDGIDNGVAFLDGVCTADGDTRRIGCRRVDAGARAAAVIGQNGAAEAADDVLVMPSLVGVTCFHLQLHPYLFFRQGDSFAAAEVLAVELVPFISHAAVRYTVRIINYGGKGIADAVGALDLDRTGMVRRRAVIGNGVRRRTERGFIMPGVVFVDGAHADLVPSILFAERIRAAVSLVDSLPVAQPLVLHFIGGKAVAVADGSGQG